MKTTIWDRLKMIISIYSIINLLPNWQKKIASILRPMNTARFFEFAYLRKYIVDKKYRGLKILDVSSPHMMAYYLSKANDVTKTNLDIQEKAFVKENSNLKFKIEDATKLSFFDNTFDLTYSISVIEHIHENYIEAILEMIRVTKKGGHVYLTFPVANKYKEDWVNKEVYANSASRDGCVFFQYRFDEKSVDSIIEKLGNIEVISKDIFWEKKQGLVDKINNMNNTKISNRLLRFIKCIYINNYYGFTMFPSEPTKVFIDGKLFGNIHIILEKK